MNKSNQQTVVLAGGLVVSVAAMLGGSDCCDPPEACCPLVTEECCDLSGATGWSCNQLSPDWCDEESVEKCPMIESFTPDRRPITYVSFHYGVASETNPSLPDWWQDCGDDGNVEGISPLPPGTPVPPEWEDNGIPDAFDILRFQLERLYDKGWRRISLRMPAGILDSQIYSTSQWWTMPQWKRDGFETIIADWIEDKIKLKDPVSLSIYAGFLITDPCTLCMEACTSGCVDFEVNCGSAATAELPPDPTDINDMCKLKQNVQPWIDVGFLEYHMDFSSPSRDELRAIAVLDDYAGTIKFVGEALPRLVCQGDVTHMLDGEAVDSLSWTATVQYIELDTDWVAECEGDVLELPPTDPSIQELGVYLLNGDGLTVTDALVHKYVRNHFVAYVTANDTTYSHMKWAQEAYGKRFFPDFVYDCGYCLADLDRDGDVDGDDSDILLANLTSTVKPWITRAHGDLNFDGKVDNVDRSILLGDWGACRSCP